MIHYKGKIYEARAQTRLEFLIEFLTLAKNLEIRVQANYAGAKLIEGRARLNEAMAGNRDGLPPAKLANVFYMEYGIDYPYPGKWTFHPTLSTSLNGLVWELEGDGDGIDPNAQFVYIPMLYSKVPYLQSITVRPIVPNPFPFSRENACIFSKIALKDNDLKLFGPGWKESSTLLKLMTDCGVAIAEEMEDRKAEEEDVA